MEQPADFTRREFAQVATSALAVSATVVDLAAAPSAHEASAYSITINGQRHDFRLDPRVTLLDLLRELLHLTGAKKGCDHGQCGACTVIADGVRINSCLALAVSYEESHITTIEGLASEDALHPLQAAFIRHDGFQCGFCTSGQICSAVAMLEEWKNGMPSAAGPAGAGEELTASQVRERMAGNICRCGAYSNIVDAIRDVGGHAPIVRSAR